jgi:hypothetical protein
MNYQLFLDDERFPISVSYGDWVIARSFDDAMYYIQYWGIPHFISFDHDLGEGKTGYDFAKSFCDYVVIKHMTLPVGFDFYVHSMNPVGRDNIKQYMDNFMDRMGYTKF